VIPAARLDELAELLASLDSADRLPLSVVFGSDIASSLAAVAAFARVRKYASVEAVELRAPDPPAARAILAELAPALLRYVEPPQGAVEGEFFDALVDRGACAKLRAGGTSPAAIPGAETVLGFLAGAAARKLPFKATAGLHHALRGNHPFTYAEAAPRGEMHGYLNLLLAAALLWQGGSLDEARCALLERDPRAIRFEASGLCWRDRRWAAEQLVEFRSSCFHSFGSCSFREPLDELAAGGWR